MHCEERVLGRVVWSSLMLLLDVVRDTHLFLFS